MVMFWIVSERWKTHQNHKSEGEKRKLMSCDRNRENGFMGNVLANQLLGHSGQKLIEE